QFFSGMAGWRAGFTFGRRRRMGGLAADPDCATLEIFLFPDRNYFLEPINGETAGFKGFCTMSRGHRDSNRGLANFDYPDPVAYREANDLPALTRLVGEFSHFGEGHRLIGLVFQAHDTAANIVAPRRAGKSDNRSGRGMRHFLLQFLN